MLCCDGLRSISRLTKALSVNPVIASAASVSVGEGSAGISVQLGALSSRLIADSEFQRESRAARHTYPNTAQQLNPYTVYRISYDTFIEWRGHRTTGRLLTDTHDTSIHDDCRILTLSFFAIVDKEDNPKSLAVILMILF